MEKNIFKPFLIVLLLMALSALALAFTVNVDLQDSPGVKMILPERLDDGWIGNELRFCHNESCYSADDAPDHYYVRDLELPDVCPDCGEKLYTMSWAEYGVLPKDTEFVKSAFTNASGNRAFVSIVLSGRERASIHRPQRCLVGQGNTIVNEHVIEVPIEGRDPVKVAVIEAERNFNTVDGEVVYYSYYAYWFVGQDRETPSHYARMFWLGWDRVVHSVAHRWAYIAVGGSREPEGREYEKDLSKFIQLFYPTILINDNDEVEVVTEKLAP